MREWRGSRTQIEVSRELGLDQALYSKYESGKRKPGRARAIVVRDVTGGMIGVGDWDQPPPAGSPGSVYMEISD